MRAHRVGAVNAIARAHSRRTHLLLSSLIAPFITPVREVHAFLGPILTKKEVYPILYPRRLLDQEFAVLLLRSGYEAVDTLDLIPMEEFQKKFWKLRQSHYEEYTVAHQPLKVEQGNLTNPLYFDFIVYAQVATIEQEIPNAKDSFYEHRAEGKTLVSRDRLLSDSASLYAAWMECTGMAVYDGLVHGFRGAQFGAPIPISREASFEEVISKISSIVHIFEERGFALQAKISDVKENSFTVTLEGPAHAWALQRLGCQERNPPIVPEYCSLALEAFLKESGFHAEHTLSVKPASVVTHWTIS